MKDNENKNHLNELKEIEKKHEEELLKLEENNRKQKEIYEKNKITQKEKNEKVLNDIEIKRKEDEQNRKIEFEKIEKKRTGK